MDLTILPNDLIYKILLYLQCPLAKIMKREIRIYEKDHNIEFYNIQNYYYVRNTMSFSSYYFDKLRCPHFYNSYYVFL